MNPFKAYDIRGIYPDEIDKNFAYNLGKAVATFLDAKKLVIGMDGRTSSPELAERLIQGILETGTNVVFLEQVSTPLFYYAIYSHSVDGGIMVTASHNPKEYNGFKICEENAIPIFKENGLKEIRRIMFEGEYKTSNKEGERTHEKPFESYVQSFHKYIRELSWHPKILFDCGNGMGGEIPRALKKLYNDKISIHTIFEEVKGDFPNHECNPVIEKNMHALQMHLREGNFDLGVAFDGDADRVVFFLSNGTMIPPDITTAIIGGFFAGYNEIVCYDISSSQIVKKYLQEKKVIPKLCPTGSPFIKSEMRRETASFGGEKSGHYIYRDLKYTDSPLLTVITLLNLLDSEKKYFDDIVFPLMNAYVSSGTINISVANADGAIEAIKNVFKDRADKILEIDGISVFTKNYSFNLRKSNTEPLVRLSIEGTSKDIVEKVKVIIEKLLWKE